MKFLLVKLNHLGDTLLLTPTLRMLRQAYPASEIDVVVRAGCEAVLEGNPDATRVLRVPGGGAARAVAGRRYDYAFDLSDSDRAKLLLLASAARVRAINDWPSGIGWKRVFFNRFSHFAWGHEHQVLRDYRTVADVLGRAEAPGPLVLDTDVDLPQKPAAPYAVIHPVSRWTFKQWLPERWAAVADSLKQRHGLGAVFSCGPDDAERNYVRSISPDAQSTDGKLSLRQLGRLIREAQLFIGVDTVAMHVAAAVQTPAVALFGPSSEWSWRPWQAPHQLVLGACACKASRNFVCDKSRPYPCMLDIGVEAVRSAAASLLAAPARTRP